MHDLFRKKYQEMMEHVEVSEEMRERIMETLEQEAAQAGAGEKTAKTEKARVGAKKGTFESFFGDLLEKIFVHCGFPGNCGGIGFWCDTAACPGVCRKFRCT